MRHALTVCRKELLDSARDRRGTLSALLLAPLGMPVLIGLVVFLLVDSRLEEATQGLSVPVVGGLAAPHLMAQLKSAGINADHDAFERRSGLAAAIRSGAVETALWVADDFGAALQSGAPARVWIMHDSSRVSSRTQSARLRSAIRAYGRALGNGRLLLRGVDPHIMRPIALLNEDVSTPRGRSILLFGMMTYFLLFASILGGSQVAIDATVGERERGSLEPLLAMPVARSTLVTGKILAAAAFMAMALAVSIATFSIASRWLPLAEAGMAINLGFGMSAGIWLMVAPFSLLAASAITFVSSFAKTLKEAWTYNSLAMLAPTLPIIFFVAKPIQASAPAMLLPSLSQHLLVTQLLKGEGIDPLHAFICVASTVCIAALLGLAASARYRGDRLLG